MPLNNTIERLRQLRSKVGVSPDYDKVNRILSSNREFLESLLKKQLASGKDEFGEDITLWGVARYHDKTIKRKKNIEGIGGITKWITLYGRGYFYAGITTKVIGIGFVFSSSVKYYEDILARSGEEIMRLSEDNLKIFRDEILIPQMKSGV